MAVAGRPWATVITAVVAALVAAGALVAASMTRDRVETTATPPTTPPVTSGVGVDGCAVEPCTVLATVEVAGTTIELVADHEARSGRVRIGGAGSSEVIEATITGMGVILTSDSLQCVPGSLSACLLRGPFADGVAGQLIVGRSTNWNEATPFQSDAGYLALADIMGGIDVEVLVAQHRCDRVAVPDCTGTPVFVQVFDLRGQVLGCTRTYAGLESLPGWPTVTLQSSSVKPCS